MYQYIHEDDENTFQLVDSTRLPKPAYQKRTRFQPNVNNEELFVEVNISSVGFFSSHCSVFDKIKLKMVVLHR